MHSQPTKVRERALPCSQAPPRIPPAAAPPSPSRKVLLFGWDAADWKVIHPLLDAGKMPHLARFLEQGVMGNIATLQPALSPTLWTSIATGKRPFKHGILGFSEPDPVTGGIRPITNLSRKTKAVWNILNLRAAAGRRGIIPAPLRAAPPAHFHRPLVEPFFPAAFAGKSRRNKN